MKMDAMSWLEIGLIASFVIIIVEAIIIVHLHHDLEESEFSRRGLQAENNNWRKRMGNVKF